MANPIVVDHIDTNDSVTLLQGRTSERSVGGETTINPTPGDDTQDAIIADFKHAEQGTITGIATGNALANSNIVSSSDRRTALAEYAQLLHTLIPINPGSGWTITDSPRSDETVDVVFSRARWQINEADPFTIQYSVEADVGGGLGGSAAADIPSANAASPQASATLDGVDLGSLESWSEIQRQETRVTALTFEDVQNNTITSKSGPVRRITISGRPTTNRDTIDDKIQALKGEDKTVVYQSAFPGESVDVVVDSYTSTRESTFESGFGEYNLELVEGST